MYYSRKSRRKELRYMNEEEKKAIDNMKSLLLYSKEHEYFSPFQEQEIDDMNIVLNLIEKQSKEIEELKKPKYILNCKTNEITKLTNDFVSKDKIKEILGIEEDIDNEKILSLLQTIVDENARLEDIEDRKVQIEYNNVFNKGVKSVEDKIKAKIDYLLKRYDSDEDFCSYDVLISILQSLLEKE